MATGTAPLPRRIGPYLPVKKLGQGGMGVVYQAQDERDPGRVVALKVISDSIAGGSGGHGDDAARRFLREAKILESLRHPNIVSFYEIGVTESKSWFAMELLGGKTLSAYVGQPWSIVLPLFVQVCAGMAYLAARRIVHRDLSPDNILVIEDDGKRIPKILDFGIAKDTTTEETIHNFTRTGLLMGKPMYWSPEQVGHLDPGERIDWRSDVYSLGIIFHRVLSGELPFHAETPVGFISAHLQERPADLTTPSGNPAIPIPVVEVVARMLEKDRTSRPSYQEIVDTFREALLAAGEDVDEISVALPLPGEATTGVTEPWSKKTGSTSSPGSFAESGPTSILEGEEPTAASVRLGALATEITPIGTQQPTKPTKVTKVTSVGTKATAVTRGGQALAEAEAEDELEEEPAPPPPSRLPKLLIAAAVVLALGFGAYMLFKKPPPPPIVAKTTGTLELNASPWAHVQAVTNVRTQQKIQLPQPSTTPMVLELPPAQYQVLLKSGVGDKTETLTVDVEAGKRSGPPVSLMPAEQAVALLD